MKEYQTTIGLEIHCQLKTKSKMFCSCDNKGEEASPNAFVCPICMGFPGVLPYTNQKAVEWTLLTALALNCKIPSFSKFDRKHYFYPDLPKGYQVSQYDKPLSLEGFLEIEANDMLRKIGIIRVHLEEDAAKLVHAKSKDYSLVDFNRAGTPLMEIVTKPDLKSPSEAKIFMQSLQQILRYLDVSEADMEKGHLRCDANISLSPKGGRQKLGIPVEIKNLNSFKALERSLEFEVSRQKEILNQKGEVKRETRGWDESKQKTISQRGKEEAPDYRYFPEPDLPPINFENLAQTISLKELKNNLPELPLPKKQRFIREYLLSAYDASILASQKEIADYYEEVLSELLNWEEITGLKDGALYLKAAKTVANWMQTEFLKILNESGKDIEDSKINPEDFAKLIMLIIKKEISGPVSKQVFLEMFESGKGPDEIVAEKGLHLVNDTDILEKIINDVLTENKKAIDDLEKGKTEALTFLVGQVMAKTQGIADPNLVRSLLKQKLGIK